MTDFIDIDGSILEGGGQILRISIALSAILGVPVRVSKIRAGRCKPGLASQHLKGIELVGEMCQARVRGASIGSTEIEFTPGPLRGGQYEADTHTAGSVSLLLQAALPCALFGAAPVELQLRGGTNAAMAPQVDFMAQTFRKLLNRFGADFEITIHKRGYFPKGGGHVSVRVSPVRYLSGVNIMQGGRVIAVQGASFVAGNLPLHLAHGMADGAKEELRPVCTKIDIKCYKEDRSVAPDNCNGINLWCTLASGNILGSDALGMRNVEGRAVGRAAGMAMRQDLIVGACIDQHAQDQVIIYMALAEGKSSIRTGFVTRHTKTAMHIAEMIAKVKFEIYPDSTLRNQNIIECTGLGLTNKHLTPAQ